MAAVDGRGGGKRRAVDGSGRLQPPVSHIFGRPEAQIMLPTRNAFLKDELKNILAALHVNAVTIAQRADIDQAYLDGYHDALQSLTVALGLVSLSEQPFLSDLGRPANITKT